MIPDWVEVTKLLQNDYADALKIKNNMKLSLSCECVFKLKLSILRN